MKTFPIDNQKSFILRFESNEAFGDATRERSSAVQLYANMQWHNVAPTNGSADIVTHMIQYSDLKRCNRCRCKRPLWLWQQSLSISVYSRSDSCRINLAYLPSLFMAVHMQIMIFINITDEEFPERLSVWPLDVTHFVKCLCCEIFDIPWTKVNQNGRGKGHDVPCSLSDFTPPLHEYANSCSLFPLEFISIFNYGVWSAVSRF